MLLLIGCLLLHQMTDQLAQVLDICYAAECGISKPIQENNSLRKGCQLVTGMMYSSPMSSDCELVAQELGKISEHLSKNFHSIKATGENYKFMPTICAVFIYIIKQCIT